MSKLTDDELIQELQQRLEDNRRSLHDLKAVSNALGVMNKKLMESEALKSNFLANIRNEINNPLTVILGLARVLAERLEGDDETAAMAGMIYSEAFDFHFQLRNIFTAASLEAGEIKPFHARCDICGLARMTIDSFAHLTRLKELEILLTCSVNSLKKTNIVYCDAEKFQSVLANLLANAIEFSHEKGKVEVALTSSRENLRLTVRDYGAGIPANKRQVIFDRFRQLDMGVRKTHRGHGIGLSIARELTEIQGGSIAVSTPKGGGALFTVNLPHPAEPQEDTLYADSGNSFIFDSGLEGTGQPPETI